MSSSNSRKLFKAFTDDATAHVAAPVAKPDVSSAQVRALFKAYYDNPALQAAVRACKSPKEKHAVIREAGLTPVYDGQIKAELAKCLHNEGSSPEDAEFLHVFVHLASCDGSMASDG